MSIEYSYDTVSSIILVSATGHVTTDDRAEFVRKIFNDSEMPSTAPILIDATGITNAPESSDTTRIVVLIQMLVLRFKRRVAYWVTGVGLVTPFSVVALSASRHKDGVRTFTSRGEAIDWLKSSDDRPA